MADPMGCDAPADRAAARLTRKSRARRGPASPGSGTAAWGRTLPKYLRSSSVS